MISGLWCNNLVLCSSGVPSYCDFMCVRLFHRSQGSCWMSGSCWDFTGGLLMESDMMGRLLMELWTDGFEGCGLDLEVVRSVGWIKKKATHLWVGGLGDGGGLRSTISIE